jgi:hypothetical protein
MEIVAFGHGLHATPIATRHDFVFAAPHPPTMRDSHGNISDFPADETTK